MQSHLATFRLARFSALSRSNPSFVLIVRPDIKPDYQAVFFDSESPIANIDAHRPKPADFLKA
jgi:hypothetical protein